MDKKPKISCIMSVYNTEKYLDECIQSILNQTYTDFEFIISDDWSTDKSKEIIRKYAKKDKRIVFLDNKENRWIVANLNDCIDKAKWDYIAIMESDDVSYPERFELEIEVFEKDPDLYLVWWYWNIIDENWDRKYDWITIENFEEIKKRCLFETPFNTPWIMFKKELWMHFKNIKYPYLWDNDLYLNTIFLNKKCINIPKFVIKKRELSTSLFFRKYLKIAKQHLLLRLYVAYKYNVYKTNKLIFLRIIWNEFKGIVGYYAKKLWVYEYVVKIYRFLFKW